MSITRLNFNQIKISIDRNACKSSFPPDLSSKILSNRTKKKKRDPISKDKNRNFSLLDERGALAKEVLSHRSRKKERQKEKHSRRSEKEKGGQVSTWYLIPFEKRRKHTSAKATRTTRSIRAVYRSWPTPPPSSP